MERELWLAGKMSEYRRLPLEPKTIMFIEEYSFGAGGVISSLFRKALTDPQYKDYTFVWTTRDYETTLDNFAGLIEDKRVMIVNREMPDFLKYMSVAGTITCGNTLPNFYVKREGQKIRTHIALSVYLLPWYSRNQLRNFVHTINDTDEFLCLDDYDESVLMRDYRISKDRIVRLSKDDIVPSAGGKKTVIISISQNARMAKSCAALASFVKRIKAVMAFYDIEVKAFVSYKFWKRYKPQKLYFGIDEICCDEADMTRYYSEACLLITDNTYRATQAQRFGLPVVIWGVKKISERFEDYYTDLQYASDWSSLYAIIERKFGGLGIDGQILYDDHQDEFIDSDDDEVEEKEVDSDDETDEDAPDESRKTERPLNELFCRRESADDVYDISKPLEKILYILRVEKEDEYLDQLGRWLDYEDKGNKEITVLFLNSAKQTLYTKLGKLHRPHLITVRAGFYQSDAHEREMMMARSDEVDGYLKNESHDFIDEEWRRLLGNARYDKIFADKSTNFFWKQMYKYPPTESFKLITKEDKQALFDSVPQEEEEA